MSSDAPAARALPTATENATPFLNSIAAWIAANDFCFFVPRGAALYLFLAARLARAATDGGRPLVDNIDRSPIPEIFRVFREVTSTLRAVTKLGGAVELVAPGSLPNDGKVIADEHGPA